MCVSCRAVCTVESAAAGTAMTKFRQFAIERGRVLFLALRVEERSGSTPGDSALSAAAVGEGGGPQRRKRRLRETGAQWVPPDVPMRELHQELSIDDQGRLMNRERSLTIPLHGPAIADVTAAAAAGSARLLMAKRLTVQVGASEELYVYVFATEDEANIARAHWLHVAATLRHVRLSCRPLLVELRLKYHHTGEEIQVAPEQLSALLSRDEELLVQSPTASS